MSDLTGQELNEHLKQVASTYNSQNPVGETPEEVQARAAAAELNQVQGSENHSGNHEVRADTPEDIAAREKKAEEEAAAAEAAKTDEEKAAEAKEAADKKAAEEAAILAAETPEQKAAREAQEAKTDKESAEAEWITTDNKDFNAAIGLMKAAGMTPEGAGKIFDKAMATGDASSVDMAALNEAVGEDQAALIMTGFTNYVSAEGQAVLERTKLVHDAVGGSENWLKMTSWAKTKARGDAEFRGKVEDITAMMNSGNKLSSELAAKEFLNLYNAQGTNSTITPKAPKAVEVHQSPTTTPASSVTPLTAREFAEQSFEANKNLRGAAQSAKLAELAKGRSAGRAKGM